MAWYPDARKRDLGKDTSALTADDLVLQLHTMVGNLTGTDRYFRTVGVFSHFGVGGKWGADATNGLDGVVYQWGDTAWRAAASLNGNRRTISVETADNAALPIEPWTDKQCDAIVGLMVWAHETHGIPLELIPDSKPGRRGIAYHRQGIDPWRVDGGELWSSSTGKVCPGDARIDQIPGLIDRARAIVAGEPDGGPFMALSDAEQAEVLRAARQINQTAIFGTTGFEGTVEGMANKVNLLINEVRESRSIVGDDEANIVAKLDELKAALTPAPPAPLVD